MSDLYLFIKFINIKIKMSKANLNGSDDFFDYQNEFLKLLEGINRLILKTYQPSDLQKM